MNQVGFTYTFTSIYEIYEKMRFIESSAFVVYLPLIVSILAGTYFLVYKYGPMMYVYLDFKKLEKVKLKKKQFIIRIKLQNEIEDQVEKELK